MAHRPTRMTAKTPDLREQILADFDSLKVPLHPEQFDAALANAERQGLSHLEFVHLRMIIIGGHHEPDRTPHR